jgi:hypothetical protein
MASEGTQTAEEIFWGLLPYRIDLANTEGFRLAVASDAQAWLGAINNFARNIANMSESYGAAVSERDAALHELQNERGKNIQLQTAWNEQRQELENCRRQLGALAAARHDAQPSSSTSTGTVSGSTQSSAAVETPAVSPTQSQAGLNATSSSASFQDALTLLVRQLHGTTKRTEKYPDPEPFKGDSRSPNENKLNFREFCGQIRIKLISNADWYEDEQARLRYVTSRVQGHAYTYIAGYVTKTRINFGTVEDLLKVLGNAFDVHDPQAEAEMEFSALQQGNKPFSKFLGDFQRLAMMAGIEPRADRGAEKVRALRQKINEELDSALVGTAKPGLDDFDGWVTLISRVASELESSKQKNRMTQPGYFSNAPPTALAPATVDAGDPMELSATSFAQNWRQHCIQNNLCMNCGKSEHFIASCPSLPHDHPLRRSIQRGGSRGGFRGGYSSGRGGYPRDAERGGFYNGGQRGGFPSNGRGGGGSSGRGLHHGSNVTRLHEVSLIDVEDTTSTPTEQGNSPSLA